MVRPTTTSPSQGEGGVGVALHPGFRCPTTETVVAHRQKRAADACHARDPTQSTTAAPAGAAVRFLLWQVQTYRRSSRGRDNALIRALAVFIVTPSFPAGSPANQTNLLPV
jgi:hypothetical protein